MPMNSALHILCSAEFTFFAKKTDSIFSKVWRWKNCDGGFRHCLSCDSSLLAFANRFLFYRAHTCQLMWAETFEVQAQSRNCYTEWFLCDVKRWHALICQLTLANRQVSWQTPWELREWNSGSLVAWRVANVRCWTSLGYQHQSRNSVLRIQCSVFVGNARESFIESYFQQIVLLQNITASSCITSLRHFVENRIGLLSLQQR